MAIDGIKRYKISLGIDENYKINLLNTPIYIKDKLIKLSDVCDIEYQESFSEVKFENGFYVNYIFLVSKKGIDLNLAIQKIDQILNQVINKKRKYIFL